MNLKTLKLVAILSLLPFVLIAYTLSFINTSAIGPDSDGVDAEAHTDPKTDGNISIPM